MSNDSNHYIPIDLISFFMILPKRLILRENIDSPFSIPSRLMFSAQSCISGPLGRTSLIGTFVLGLDLFGGFLPRIMFDSAGVCLLLGICLSDMQSGCLYMQRHSPGLHNCHNDNECFVLPDSKYDLS